MSAAFNAADVQGNILRGYRKALVRYLMIEVTERAAARRWLVATVTKRDGLPQITTEEPWVTKPETCFNIGLTYEGLRALGTRGASLETFPTEFSQGMASRAVKLGDVGPSAPQTWPAPFDNPKRLHLILSIYGDALPQIERIQQQALTAGSGLTLLGTRDGWTEEGNFVHFGYRDSIAQPKFKEIHDPSDYADGQPPAPLGTVLLGYETNFENLLFRVPTPPELGFNGSFNAFRVLAQDVVGFEAYLDKAACDLLKHPHVDDVLAPGAEATIGAGLSRKAALREIVAANMCGRWRCGTPLALSPNTPNPQPAVPLEDFDYTETSTCPYGAHIRRANPRGGKIVQRVANHSRRLIRRGMPYGPVYDPADPKPDVERGLLGNFIGANLGAQFEAMSCDWINLGLQDPRVTGSNDPLLGANDPETSWFDIPLKSGEVIRLRGLPRFVETRGGAYTFLPSIAAIRHLGSLNT